MAWGVRRQNLHVAYSSTAVAVATIIGASLIMVLQFLLTDMDTLAGNKGATFAAIEAGSGILLAVLFGLNVGLLWYKLRLASSIKAKEGGTALMGGFLGLLVTGCPACSITLASYLGLAGILSALPFSGLELKVLGIAVLIYSTDNILKNLLTCKPRVAAA